MKRSLLLVYIVIFVVSASMPAHAGKGGASTIELAPLTQTTLADSQWPRFGDQVTFRISTSRTAYPWVQNRCWQDGRLVLEQWHGFFDGYRFGRTFTLGPTNLWTGGAASCEARLISQDNGRDHVLASARYDAAP